MSQTIMHWRRSTFTHAITHARAYTHAPAHMHACTHTLMHRFEAQEEISPSTGPPSPRPKLGQPAPLPPSIFTTPTPGQPPTWPPSSCYVAPSVLILSPLAVTQPRGPIGIPKASLAVRVLGSARTALEEAEGLRVVAIQEGRVLLDEVVDPLVHKDVAAIWWVCMRAWMPKLQLCSGVGVRVCCA